MLEYKIIYKYLYLYIISYCFIILRIYSFMKGKILDDTLYTVKEVAKFFKVSEQKVRQLIKSGEIKPIKISKNYRISEEEINKFLKGEDNGKKSRNKK